MARAGRRLVLPGLLAAVAAAGGPAAGLAAALAPAPRAATAATVGVIHRCTSPSGAVALQDDPCPAGHRQERREIAAFAPPTATTGAGAAGPGGVEAADARPAAAATAAAPVIEAGRAPRVAPLSMPPPLWRCTDLNGRSRLADAYDPQPRCVPLSVLGVDLSRAPPSAATLCRTIEDDCVELGGDAACAAWKERLEAAESALRHAFSDTQAQRRRERERAKAVLENDCTP